jgi:hypothetical protein
MGQLLKFRGARVGRGDENDAWMFNGLAGLAVVIEDLDPIAVEAGLDRTNIQLHVERRLSEAGIPVAPFLRAAEGEAVAVLYVAIGTERDRMGPIAFFLSLQVCEEAALVRDPDQGGGVTTWLTNGVWASLMGDLQRDITAAIDEGLTHFATEFAASRSRLI